MTKIHNRGETANSYSEQKNAFVPKYAVGSIVMAEFTTNIKVDGKKYQSKCVVSEGVVRFSDEDQRFYVESLYELPDVYWEDNGRLYNNYRAWLVQGKQKLTTEIKRIVKP